MNPNQDSGSARSRDKNVEAAATPPMKGHSSHIPRVAQRLNKVAKRTMDETQSRLVVALLRSYFKSFIVGFDPKMLKVESIHRGLKMTFPDPAGFDINCAAFNSLNSQFCPESLFVSRLRIFDLTFTALFHAGLSGMTFSEASLHVARMEVTFVGSSSAQDGNNNTQEVPRLRKDLEARLLKEWYGPEVDVNGPSSRVADGMVVRVDKLSFLFPGSMVVEMEGCLAVSVDQAGREVALPECWEEDAAADTKVVRKQMSCEKLKVDHLVEVPLAEGEFEDPTAPPRQLLRAPFLNETFLDVDAVLTKAISSGDWKDVNLAFEKPMLGFMLGALPVRISARGSQSPGPGPAMANSVGNGGGGVARAIPPSAPVAKRKKKKGLFSCLCGSSRSKDDDDDDDAAEAGKVQKQTLQQKKQTSSSQLEGFVCPECLAKFQSGEALMAHFEAGHAHVVSAGPRARNSALGSSFSGLGGRQPLASSVQGLAQGLGVSTAATGLSQVGATLGSGLAVGLSTGLELTSGLGASVGAKVGQGLGEERMETLGSTLEELEAAAVEQPMAMLAVFAEGLDLFDEALFDDVDDDGEDDGLRGDNGGGSGGGGDGGGRKGGNSAGGGGAAGSSSSKTGGRRKLLAVMEDLEAATSATLTRVDEALEKQMRKVAGDGAVDQVKNDLGKVKNAIADGVAKGVGGGVEVASATASVTTRAAGKAAQGDLQGSAFAVGGGLADGGAFAVSSLQGGLNEGLSVGMGGLSGLGNLGASLQRPTQQQEAQRQQQQRSGQQQTPEQSPGAGLFGGGFGAVKELTAGIGASLKEGQSNTAGLAESVGASFKDWEDGVKSKFQPLGPALGSPV